MTRGRWRLVRVPDGACPLCHQRGDYYSEVTQLFYPTPTARAVAERDWAGSNDQQWRSIVNALYATERELLHVIDDLRQRAGATETIEELREAVRAYTALAGNE